MHSSLVAIDQNQQIYLSSLVHKTHGLQSSAIIFYFDFSWSIKNEVIFLIQISMPVICSRPLLCTVNSALTILFPKICRSCSAGWVFPKAWGCHCPRRPGCREEILFKRHQVGRYLRPSTLASILQMLVPKYCMKPWTSLKLVHIAFIGVVELEYIGVLRIIG